MSSSKLPPFTTRPSEPDRRKTQGPQSVRLAISHPARTGPSPRGPKLVTNWARSVSLRSARSRHGKPLPATRSKSWEDKAAQSRGRLGFEAQAQCSVWYRRSMGAGSRTLLVFFADRMRGGSQQRPTNQLWRHFVEHRGEIVQCDQPTSINHVPEGEDDHRYDCRPDQRALEIGGRRRAGVAAVCDRSAFLLAAHSPRQHCKQDRPPDDEEDGDCGRYRHE